ncbi:MAG: site-specific integrase [Polyangia bacterium]
MPHPKAPPRVKGPYSERGGTRFRIRICGLTGHHDVYFSTKKEALAGMRRAAREFCPSSVGRSLAQVLDLYLEDKVQRGVCNPRSADAHRVQLRSWLCDYLDEDIGKLTPKRAVALYQSLVATPTPKTGRPPTAATQRFKLKLAQALFRWAVQKGYIRESPFAGVQPVGRPNRGKKQLRFDEAERFITAAFLRFDERGDPMALAAVTALLLGCRAGEVLHLRVRDLDCGGAKLWVAARDSDYRGKTDNAARDCDVPEVLRPRLLKLTAGRAPTDYLFGATSEGRARSRQVLHSAVQRLCVAAGVPVVCPHSLRGLWATASVRSGALSHAVAAALGHGSFAVTAKHYVQPGAISGARTERLVELLELGERKPAVESPSVSAEQILAELPRQTLTRLVLLASQKLAQELVQEQG